MIGMIMISFLIGQVVPDNSPVPVNIRIKAYREDTYYLLTETQPLDITIEGPTWVRIYTRLPWHPDWTGMKTYKIIRQENDQDEKFLAFQTERSAVARFGSMRLSKWRSFFINVPKGKHHYRLIHWQSPADSVFIKIAYEAPGQWQEIVPQSYAAKLELIEEERAINYYEIAPGNPVLVDVNGPIHLKFVVRLHCGPLPDQEHLFKLTINENNKTLKTASFKVHRSETTSYRNQPGTIPSNPRLVYLNLGKGLHRLTVQLAGSDEKAGIRVLAEQK